MPADWPLRRQTVQNRLISREFVTTYTWLLKFRDHFSTLNYYFSQKEWSKSLKKRVPYLDFGSVQKRSLGFLRILLPEIHDFDQKLSISNNLENSGVWVTVSMFTWMKRWKHKLFGWKDEKMKYCAELNFVTRMKRWKDEISGWNEKCSLKSLDEKMKFCSVH